MLCYASVEDRIPADHPLRTIHALVNPILVALSPRFDSLYARMGRPSIPPERLLRALLLQVRFTIRSERQLMEQLNYNLLFRWFVGLNPDDATVFSKNRDRLIDGQIAEACMAEVLLAADQRGQLSHEHFTVDGTLLEAWASHNSFRPKENPSPPPSDGDAKNPDVNYRGEKRSNATHQSVTDPEARRTLNADFRHASDVLTRISHSSEPFRSNIAVFSDLLSRRTGRASVFIGRRGSCRKHQTRAAASRGSLGCLTRSTCCCIVQASLLACTLSAATSGATAFMMRQSLVSPFKALRVPELILKATLR